MSRYLSFFFILFSVFLTQNITSGCSQLTGLGGLENSAQSPDGATTNDDPGSNSGGDSSLTDLHEITAPNDASSSHPFQKTGGAGGGSSSGPKPQPTMGGAGAPGNSGSGGGSVAIAPNYQPTEGGMVEDPENVDKDNSHCPPVCVRRPGRKEEMTRPQESEQQNVLLQEGVRNNLLLDPFQAHPSLLLNEIGVDENLNLPSSIGGRR